MPQRRSSLGERVEQQLCGAGDDLQRGAIRKGRMPLESLVLAMVPDLICVLDRETAEPITTEGLKYGQRVRVVGVSVPPAMRTPQALAVFGPAYFGIAEAYTPIERLAAG